ncbi:uncharacterized protein COLE_02093 [Cutaneotrichosporon oleaginosum]|nr:hypothetical protein COLE_02093 [Cutaneotrichosporon oleaginosum]
MPNWVPPRSRAAARERPYNWQVFWSYFPDWALTIFLWVLDGYRRLFSVTDTSLAHPYAEHERIPVWSLALIAGVFPAVVIIASGSLMRSPWDVHSGLLGLVLCLALGVTFTQIIKITVGRPRPDLFSRCQLPQDLTSNPIHGLTAWTACTRTDKLQEGFRSFPSGHSSFAWSGMWYLEMYLMAKLRVANRRGYTIKSWILLIPVSASTLVSVSRTMDYRHHATDVIAGAVIGIIVAWWSYRQYYPSLGASKSWRPYEPRISRDTELQTHGRTASRDEHALLPSHMTNSPVERPYASYPPQQYEPRFSEGRAVDKTYSNGGIATANDTRGAAGMSQVEGALANNPAFPESAHAANHAPHTRAGAL